MDDITFELNRWKNHAFRDFDLKFSDAVASLQGARPKIEARPYNPNTWSVRMWFLCSPIVLQVPVRY